MSKYLDENGLLYLWGKITDAIDPKADKIPEVNHGTSDTTFTLTPNIMHIWGEVSSLTLSLPSDTNTVLDEYMFTFTCPSATATTLTLPSTVKWIQEPNLTAGKTYQVSIINGLAGYLTDDMEIGGGDENIIEEIQVNGVTQSVVDKAVDITVPTAVSDLTNDSGFTTNIGTVTSVTVNGSNYTPDTNGLVNLGTISGGEGGTGGEYNVIEGVTFNGSSAPITNKIAAITYTAPTLSKGTTTGNGNAVTDISVSDHTITLTKGTTFLTSHQDISGKANDADVVHKAGNETITGNKTFQGLILVNNSNNYIEDSSGYLLINSDTGVLITGNGLETFECGIYSDEQIEAPSILCTTTNNRASNKFFATDGTIQTLPTGSGGEANVIESVKVNGTALTVTNKAVDITAVPASIVTQDATHRFVSDTEKSTWNTDTKNTAGATEVSLSSSENVYLVGAKEQTANPQTYSKGSLFYSTNSFNCGFNNIVIGESTSLGGEARNDIEIKNVLGIRMIEIHTPTTLTIFCNGTLLDGNLTIGSGKSLTMIGSTDFSDIIVGDGNTAKSLQDVLDTFLTSHQSIKTVNNNTITGTGNVSVGTITGITMNGASKGTSGVVDLGTVITSETALSKGTTSGSGNAITDISVSGHTITLTKGSTFLTSHQSIKTLNGYTLTGTGSVDLDSEDIDYIPTLGASLTYLDSPGTMNTSEALEILDAAIATKANTSGMVTVYSGSSTPSNSLGSNGDIYIKTDISAGGEEE